MPLSARHRWGDPNNFGRSRTSNNGYIGFVVLLIIGSVIFSAFSLFTVGTTYYRILPDLDASLRAAQSAGSSERVVKHLRVYVAALEENELTDGYWAVLPWLKNADTSYAEHYGRMKEYLERLEKMGSVEADSSNFDSLKDDLKGLPMICPASAKIMHLGLIIATVITWFVVGILSIPTIEGVTLVEFLTICVIIGTLASLLISV